MPVPDIDDLDVPVTEPNEVSLDDAANQPGTKSRLGLVLFVGYTTLYLGFVLINAFAADVMDTVIVGGLNLAIVYGFGLILVAIVFALVYGLAGGGEVSTPETVGQGSETQA